MKGHRSIVERNIGWQIVQILPIQIYQAVLLIWELVEKKSFVPMYTSLVILQVLTDR